MEKFSQATGVKNPKKAPATVPSGPANTNPAVTAPPAQKPPSSPVAQPAQTKPSSIPTQNQQSYIKSNAIVQMQQAMNNLHLDLQSKMETKSGVAGAESTTPFLQWIMDKYIGGSKGKSLLQTDLAAKQREDVLKKGPQNLGQAASTTKANNSFFKNFLDSIKNVGASTGIKGEAKPDGVWGPRTQNSLKLVNAFYQMMMQLEKSLGDQVSFFPKVLNEISASANPPLNKGAEYVANVNNIAIKLAEEIEEIRNVFDQFYQNVFEKYNEYTSSKKPFLTIGPKQKFDQSETQQTIENWFKAKKQNYNFFLQNLKRPLPIEIPQNLTDGTGPKFPITLDDLSHTKSFVNFVTNNQLIMNNKLVNQTTMPGALKAIEALLATAKPTADKSKSGVPMATKWE